jgi:MarR-like DNA-binding transcriptional regulator SgrR of sgrS sRNA
MLALAAPGAARTRPHYGGVLHVETEGDPWQRPDGLARRLVLDGLTAIDEDGAVRPALAVEWSSDDSDHRWLFKLRPGVHFHDGTLLTSVNAVAALNAACAANCPWTAVRAVGASVVFVGDAPMPNLPALLAGDAYRLMLTITSDGKAVCRFH